MMTRTLDRRKPRLHDVLVARARAAQDEVFGDSSVDRTELLESLKGLADRVVAQVEAMAKVGAG